MLIGVGKRLRWYLTKHPDLMADCRLLQVGFLSAAQQETVGKKTLKFLLPAGCCYTSSYIGIAPSSAVSAALHLS